MHYYNVTNIRKTYYHDLHLSYQILRIFNGYHNHILQLKNVLLEIPVVLEIEYETNCISLPTLVATPKF